MGTALQKPWMKDLSPPVIKLAKAKAVEATQAWNNTVTGILRAAKAIWEVREKIGGAPAGAFSAWAEEELQRAQETASHLAIIGARYAAFSNVLLNLPPSWGTLYEIAKEPDAVFKRALRQVRPEMTRPDVRQLILDARESLAPKEPEPRRVVAAAPAKPVKPVTSVAPAPAADSFSATPAHAAKQLTANWKGLLQDVRQVAEETRRDHTRLSPEAQRFIVHNYVRPLQEILEEVVKWLA